MSPERPTPTEARVVFRVSRLYELALLLFGAALPAVAIAYLDAFQSPEALLVEHGSHEAAIAVATVQSAFVSYVVWRCYASSGEPLLRWLTLSSLGFTLVYLPHGLFTRLSAHHLALFLLYGPVSRLAMAGFLLAGLAVYGRPSHSPGQRASPRFWLGWIAGFLLVDALVAWVALTPGAPLQTIRLSLELGALAVLMLGLGLVLVRRLRSAMMVMYAVSLAYFAQSSVAFVLARPWNHMWWLAHLIFSGGFCVLSYGVLRAFHTTRAFSLVFSQEEIMKQLAASKAYAEDVVAQLRTANQNLEVLAATDPLTGLSNRRHFLIQAQVELARFLRTGAPVTLLALDLDHFKRVNDLHGHHVGDEVLKGFAAVIRRQLRPTDHIARWGGEEFMILLCGTAGAEARAIAERLRDAVERGRLTDSELAVPVTVSVGLAELPADGLTQERLFSVADQRLYRAKAEGRNRVVDGSGSEPRQPPAEGLEPVALEPAGARPSDSEASDS
jgi:two-component system, cell cycle response regulator